MLYRHIDLGPPLPASGWRTIAIGTWRTAKDPSVYGVLEIDARPAQAAIERLSAKTGTRITFTHVVGRAVALALAEHPQINAVLRFGRIYPRRYVTLFFQVATDAKGEDLSGVTVEKAETKDLVTIAREIATKVAAVRDGSDQRYTFIKKLMAALPGWLSGTLLDLTGFIQYALNLWSPLLGTPRDPVGSVMITNIGSLGLEFAFAPLVPYSRVPLVIALAAIRERPVAKDGQVLAIPTVRLCVTFDHRLVDGVHAARLAEAVERRLLAPDGL